MFVSPLKKFNYFQKIFLYIKTSFCKTTHSVKDELNFQFSFATNEQV